jgi:hypothetical protein
MSMVRYLSTAPHTFFSHSVSNRKETNSETRQQNWHENDTGMTHKTNPEREFISTNNAMRPIGPGRKPGAPNFSRRSTKWLTGETGLGGTNERGYTWRWKFVLLVAPIDRISVSSTNDRVIIAA